MFQQKLNSLTSLTFLFGHHIYNLRSHYCVDDERNDFLTLIFKDQFVVMLLL